MTLVGQSINNSVQNTKIIRKLFLSATFLKINTETAQDDRKVFTNLHTSHEICKKLLIL